MLGSAAAPEVDGAELLSLDMYASPQSPVMGSPVGPVGLQDSDLAMYFPSSNGGSPPPGMGPMFSLRLNVPRFPTLGKPSAWSP